MSNPSPVKITGSLSDLQDIIIPDSASFLPPAPAWYAAAGLIAFFLIRFSIKRYKVFQENRYRRDAVKELDRLEKIILSSNDAKARAKCAMALPVLLKQTAISAYERRTVADLSRERWFSFLDKKGSMKAFSGESGRILSICAYGSPDQINALSESSYTELIAMIRQWIQTHLKEPNVI